MLYNRKAITYFKTFNIYHSKNIKKPTTNKQFILYYFNCTQEQGLYTSGTSFVRKTSSSKSSFADGRVFVSLHIILSMTLTSWGLYLSLGIAGNFNMHKRNLKIFMNSIFIKYMNYTFKWTFMLFMG